MLGDSVKYGCWRGAIVAAIFAVNPAHAQTAAADKPGRVAEAADAPQAATDSKKDLKRHSKKDLKRDSKREGDKDGKKDDRKDAHAEAGLEEVVVTAEKRSVDLQHAPLSVTAVSDQTLKQSNIVDPVGLNGHVPGLQINPSGGSEVMVSIRGVGSQTPENLFTQPGVSFHIDGVYIPNSIALNMGFLDVNRVEVLRGPQGTVFGQSSTGGAINVITKQPVLGSYFGDLTTTLGNYNYNVETVTANVPIGDTAAVRAVFQDTKHDGYSIATSVPGGNYGLDDANNMNYKLVGLWAPTDDLSFTLSAQQYHDRHHGAALKSLTDPNPDPREVTQDFPAQFALDMNIEALTAKYTLPWATLKSITSYQTMNGKQSFDSDRSDFVHFGGYDTVAAWNTNDRNVMEELTLSSNPNTVVDWIGGLFLLHSHTGEYVVEYKGTGANDPTPVLPTNTLPSAIPSNLSFENLSLVDRTSWAPFAQATYHVTDALRLTGGLRYNADNYQGWAAAYYGPQQPRNSNDTALTGKVEADYDLTRVNMVYASWSRGYKPGGVNPTTQNAEVVKNTFNEETVESYEIGSKNRFLDNHLNVNLSAFYAIYSDMQYIQEDPVPYSGGIGNIPKVDMWGAEVEAKYRMLDDRLELGGNLTTLAGKIPEDYFALDRRLADAAAAASGLIPYTPAWFAVRGAQTINVKGSAPPNMPSYAGGVSATWLQSFSGHGELSSRIEYLFRGPYEARVFNEPGIDNVPSYGQVNLFFEYVPDGQPWKASFSVTNLLNTAGVVGRYVDPYGSGVVSNQYIPPRQFLLSMNYKF